MSLAHSVQNHLKLPNPSLQFVQDLLAARATHRLNAVYQSARIIPFDDTSRFLFLSDLHRGNGSRVDAFKPNSALYLHMMQHYFERGFTYVEVGDGDELWQHHGMAPIKRAYSPVFEWLHRFNALGRLHMVVGNHDIRQSAEKRRVVKDGLLAEEGFRLRHQQTGQELFVVHGHQADARCDDWGALSRFIVRYVWRPLLAAGYHADCTAKTSVTRWVETRLQGWVERQRQLMICGHTHFAHFAQTTDVPYFNCGSGIHAGIITGLEIVDGAIRPIRWTACAQSFERTAGVALPLAQFKGW